MLIDQAQFPTRRRRWPTHNQRSAVTLVELLIVMAVIVLLAGLTLPTVRSVLKDQRMTECARVFSTMVEAAKAKAIYTGRPVALILERMPVEATASNIYKLPLDNTCHRLSIGEVFPPYEGDWSGATGTIVAAAVPTVLQIPLARVASLIDPSTGTATGLVNAFDLIQFGERPQLFVIQNLQYVAATGNVEITFVNPPAGFAESQWTVSGGETRFRIYRQPTKSVVGAVSLPKGTCIDLTNSGVGMRFAPPPPAPLPPPPVANYQFEVGQRTTTLANQFSKIHIIFNARGAIETCYYFDFGRPAADQRVVISPTGLFFFQVGRTDQVVHSAFIATTGAESSRDDFLPNLYDTGNLWVTINPYSGAVSTAQNLPCNRLAYRGVQISEARQLAAQALGNGKH